MRLGFRGHIGMGLLAAMVIAVAGGCVTHPPPVAVAVANSQPQPTKSASHAGGEGRVAGAAVAPRASAPESNAGPDATTAPAATAAPVATAAPAATATAMSPPPTSAERRAALDKQFDDSLDAFDARLRQAQQKIAQDRDARQATVAATTTSASTPARGDGTEASVEARAERPGDLRSDKSAGVTATVAGNGAAARVIPDGNDDDIVARRLRKAADQETDPELKDKLWREYVEYKKNTQVR